MSLRNRLEIIAVKNIQFELVSGYFNYILINIETEKVKMLTQQPKTSQNYYLLNQKTNMKFIPKQFYNLQEKLTGISRQSGLSSRLKRILTLKKDLTESQESFNSQPQINNNSVLDSNFSSPSTGQNHNRIKPSPLVFSQKLSPDSFIIGNEYQIDIIRILGASECHFVETEHFFSFAFQQKILCVAIDNIKFNYLVIATEKYLYVYNYDSRNIHVQAFKNPARVKLSQQPVKVKAMKDGHICLFFKKEAIVYFYEDGKCTRKKNIIYKFKQALEGSKVEIFSIPKPQDLTLNVFFAEDRQSENIFCLWCLEIQFFSAQVHEKTPKKIYEIPKNLKEDSRILNFQKGIYLFVTQNQVSAMKEGYVVDSVNVNLSIDFSELDYIGQNRLVHVTNVKIEIYDFHIDTSCLPNRLKVRPIDSFLLHDEMPEHKYKNVIQINNNLLFLYEQDLEFNKSASGEVCYSFFLTYPISRSEKIKTIFGTQKAEYEIGSEELIEKCDMAKKMGLTQKQIYLQLWNRTLKTSTEDYKILLSVGDFESIKEELYKKLRKTSIAFKEIFNVYHQCLFILKSKVSKSTCTLNDLSEYIYCHLFMRKLNMFKEMYLLKQSTLPKKETEQEPKIMKMNIQEYQDLQSLHIKQKILSLVDIYCHQKIKDESLIEQIRFILCSFKFVLRTIYWDLLSDIVNKAGPFLLELLKSLPQLLPFKAPQITLETKTPVGFYDGVWPQITGREWKQSLYIDSIFNYENREVIEEAIKDIYMKRNFLSKHDLVTISKEEIVQNQEKINSEWTFYHFISLMLEQVKDLSLIKEIVQFMEDTYEMFPEKIRGQVLLKYKIYSFFKEHKILPKDKPSLFQFLNFRNYELINHCFAEQRDFKGLILMHIKPIFEQICGGERGNELFNSGLLNYFISNLSEISDLKYILNRINHKKLQFHQKNQKMYEVILESLQRKMLVGTGSDIPIAQVMIYIEKIPWYTDHTSDSTKGLLYLKQIQKIQSEVQILQEARVNLSIYQIIKSCDQVINKLVGYLYDKAQITDQFTYQEIQKLTFEIIERLRKVSKKIYDEQNAQLIFFYFISRLCDDIYHIQNAQQLLKNPIFAACSNQGTPSKIVQYMYRKKMRENPQMIINTQYVQKLVTFLPGDDLIRNYIQSEMRLASMLSYQSNGNLVFYPISEGILTLQQLKILIFNLPGAFVRDLNLNEVYQACHAIQKFASISLNEGQEQHNFITKKQIYEVVILKLLESKLIKSAISVIKTFLILEEHASGDIIYPILLLLKISAEFNEENRKKLLLCVYYFFQQPLQLMKIIEVFVNKALSAQEVREQLRKAIEKGQSFDGFDKKNPLFQKDLETQFVTDKLMLSNFMRSILQTQHHIQKSRQQFKSIHFSMIIPILCNDPYLLTKYIEYQAVDISSIRCYLSFAIREQIFNSLYLLELGRRICLILLMGQKKSIKTLIAEYSNHSLELEIQILNSPEEVNYTNESEMWRSAEAFRKKKIAFIKQLQKQHISPSESRVQKSIRLKRAFSQSPNIEEQDPFDYPFQEIDHDNFLDIKPRKSKLKQIKSLTSKSLNENDADCFGIQDHLLINKKSSPQNSQLEIVFSKPKSIDRSFNSMEGKGKLSYDQFSQDDEAPKLIKLIIPEYIEKEQKKQREKQQQHIDISAPSLKKPFESPTNSENPKIEEKLAEDIESYKPTQALKSQRIADANPETQSSQKIEQTPQEVSLTSLLEEFFTKNATISEQFNSSILDLSMFSEKNIQTSTIRQICKMIYLGQEKILQQLKVNHRLKLIKQLLLSSSKDTNQSLIIQNSFEFLIKTQELQDKIVKGLEFKQILPAKDLFENYSDSNTLYEKIYPNFYEHLQLHNAHYIGHFFSRAFSNADLKGEVIWDVLMKTAAKFDEYNEDEKKMTLELIELSLSKIALKTWLKKYNSFKTTIFGLESKSQLLQTFCNYLRVSSQNNEAIQFLQKIDQIESIPKVKELLTELKKERMID